MESDQSDSDSSLEEFSSEDDIPLVELSETAWKKRLELLSTLLLRENEDGYQQPENIEERRSCMRARNDFLLKLENELTRREKRPTNRDQVENALYSIVDKICGAQKTQIRTAKGKIIDKAWHTASLGHIMTVIHKDTDTPSPTKRDKKSTDRASNRKDENSHKDGSKSSYVTDLPFVDMIISHSGLMLPLVPIIPPPLPPPLMLKDDAMKHHKGMLIHYSYLFDQCSYFPFNFSSLNKT